jgi:hypothetical protein
MTMVLCELGFVGNPSQVYQVDCSPKLPLSDPYPVAVQFFDPDAEAAPGDIYVAPRSICKGRRGCASKRPNSTRTCS